jgi:hypothetical protein
MITIDQARSLYDRLTARGFEPSADAVRLYASMLSSETPAELLAEAGADLRAATLAGDQEAISAAREAVAGATWEHLDETRRGCAVELVRVIAEPAFGYVADIYNAVGKTFGEAVGSGLIDEDPAIVMTTGKPKQRAAWAAVPGLVAELDSLSALLGDLVKHGRNGRYRSVADPKYAHFPLALLVTVGEAHVRRLVECWCFRGYQPQRVNPQPPTAVERACMGRGGRWAGLVFYGAELRVPCTLAGYEPLVVRECVRVHGGVLDPYDSSQAMAVSEAHEAEAGKRERVQAEARRRMGGVA